MKMIFQKSEANPQKRKPFLCTIHYNIKWLEEENVKNDDHVQKRAVNFYKRWCIHTQTQEKTYFLKGFGIYVASNRAARD